MRCFIILICRKCGCDLQENEWSNYIPMQKVWLCKNHLIFHNDYDDKQVSNKEAFEKGIGCLGVIGIIMIIIGIFISLAGVGAAIGIPNAAIGAIIWRLGLHGFYKAD